MKGFPNRMNALAALLPSVIFAFLALSSCDVNHFITDPSYRKTVETDLKDRLAKADSLKNFFMVDPKGRELVGVDVPA
ncbi:MAG: hypothetical protein II029_05330, partial [Bacteroidales bacterium]|nr:hypothetical protein [Bacteroidales bacterium]